MTATPGGWILAICTANQCRSPMAAALLAERLAAGRIDLPVRSAGTMTGRKPALPEVAAAMAALGTDISCHLSRPLQIPDLTGACLVIGMAREHVRRAVVLAPATWPRAFTLKDLVARAELAGPRPSGEPLERWLGRLHAGRTRSALLGDSPQDDVPDPAGRPQRAYAETAALLERLTARLAWLGWQAG